MDFDYSKNEEDDDNDLLFPNGRDYDEEDEDGPVGNSWSED